LNCAYDISFLTLWSQDLGFDCTRVGFLLYIDLLCNIATVSLLSSTFLMCIISISYYVACIFLEGLNVYLGTYSGKDLPLVIIVVNYKCMKTRADLTKEVFYFVTDLSF
jgi:hypothetical protein